MENILLESVEFFKLMLRHSVSRVSYFETSSSKLLTPVEALEEAKEAIEATRSLSKHGEQYHTHSIE